MTQRPASLLKAVITTEPPERRGGYCAFLGRHPAAPEGHVTAQTLTNKLAQTRVAFPSMLVLVSH